MNPIQVSQELQKTLVNYLLTTFDVNRDGQEPELATALRQAFETPGALFQGPFLEVTPPYQTGCTLEMLIQNGWLSPALLNMACFQRGKPIPPTAPLYSHQENAIEKLTVDGRNIIISSGTGSGKTESFLIPILNDCLVDDSPGVRAILIYPMNALVNDQLDRLRELLQGTNITFGRYTSELVYTRQQAERKLEQGKTYLKNEIISREEIRSGTRIPQILITNYAMLEYLLLRPDDAPLFQQSQWKYLVLDEAHTYTGAKAIEVSLLIRRLKQRLNLSAGHLRCIATSATLTGDNAPLAAKFAQNLFGEEFTADDVIFGVTNPDYVPDDSEVYTISAETYLHQRFPDLLEEVRHEADNTAHIALWLAEMGLIANNKLDQADELSSQAYLWHVLKGNQDITRLRDWLVAQKRPVSFKDAADFIFNGRLPTIEDQERALYHLIELAALARPESDKLSLLPARYHLFARSPHGAWVCLNPHCSGKQHHAASGWSRLFAYRRDRCDMCHCPVYPLTICRTCGQVYVRMMVENDRYLAEAEDIFNPPQPNYFTWSPIAENQALADVEDDDVELILASESPQKLFQEPFILCLHCQRAGKYCQCSPAKKQHVTLQQTQEKEERQSGRKTGTRANPVTHMNQCARCHDKEIVKRQEIVREISMSTTNPLSVVTQALYRNVPESIKTEIQQKPSGGRKLLTFYDSRQGAATFAAFLQDISNQELYRHIIPTAINQLWSQNKGLPNLREISQAGADIGWQNQIFPHDPSIMEAVGIFPGQKSLRGPQKRGLATFVRKHALAEFTTRRRLRRSLESLGLVGVQYFEPEQLPDFAILAHSTGFTPTQTRTLVEYLLDGLRNGKVITLDGINRDDKIFGRNIFNPALIRSGKPGKYEVAWIGATPRQVRRRLVQKMLAWCQLPATDKDVKNTLAAIFDWLREETDLLVGRPSEGYRLNSDHLFFQTEGLIWYRCRQCRRLHYRGDNLICPHPFCHGTLEPIDISYLHDSNYYYRSLRYSLLPVRVEEHTAQLETDKGQTYQEAFKGGDINVLSCSTTFEMGIDLGDLQTVVLSNIPPTVANYKQRSGRAGRRVGGTAFILAWAGERPHDQTHFTGPLEIMAGEVHVPYLEINNELITQRHINAIILSAFLRYQKSNGRDDLSKTGSFFDSQVVDYPHIIALKQWLTSYRSEIESLLKNFPEPSIPDSTITNRLTTFWTNMQDRGVSEYQRDADRYLQTLEQANQTFINSGYTDPSVQDIMRTQSSLLNRLREEDLINWLSDNGVLPSYSFPLHMVNLRVPPEAKLRLQRDLRLAIREYAPGQEVVADKRLWLSNGLDYRGKAPLIYEYHICDECNHLRAVQVPGASLDDPFGPCPVCNHQAIGNRRTVQRYVVPDGFQADKRSGKPAGQYVNHPPVIMRSALFPTTLSEWMQLGQLVEYGYDRYGKLLYVNEGVLAKGFTICPQCGQDLKQKNMCPMCHQPGQKITLGFEQTTDTLHLRFMDAPHAPLSDDFSFWMSLLQAFIQGASRALQIERHDIDGVLHPIKTATGWHQTIVLYDDVPGGAGHVKRIQEEIAAVVEAALAIANCPDCTPNTSCYHCLRDYNNQTYHGLLRRGPAVAYLEALFASFSAIPDELPGVGCVIAINRPRWLMQEVSRTQSHLWLAVNTLTPAQPLGEQKGWLDLFQDLLLRGCEVDLCVTAVPTPTRHDTESLLICDHLRLLMQKGLHLWQIDQRPEWAILIDSGLGNNRAIKPANPTESFILDDKTGEIGLFSTTHPQAITQIQRTINTVYLRPVPAPTLELSPYIQLKRLSYSQNRDGEINEESLFGDTFSQPVTHLLVNDRYLLDEERLCNRLGAYLTLANQHGILQHVLVRTWPAGEKGRGGSKDEQNRAIQKLKSKFPTVTIDVNRKEAIVEHDRFIILTRTNGTKARILIGQGLDFIQPDGTIRPTHIIIEDPYSE